MCINCFFFKTQKQNIIIIIKPSRITVKRFIMTKRKEGLFHVQETIGGWLQVSTFEGTYEECRKFMAERCHNGNFNIVADCDYVVDYL